MPEKQTVVVNGLPASCISCSGNRIQPIFTRVYDEDRKCEVVKQTSETDIYELIQESNNTSDITLLKKMINGGSVEPPEDPIAQYGIDMANMPKSIHDVYDQANSAQTAFDALAPYYQEAFGSVEGMRKAMLDGSYASVIEKAYSKQIAIEAAKAKASEGGAE